MRKLFIKHFKVCIAYILINTLVCIFVGGTSNPYTGNNTDVFRAMQMIYIITIALYLLFCFVMNLCNLVGIVVALVKKNGRALERFVKSIMWFVHGNLICLLSLFPLGYLAMGLGL